MIEYLVTFLKEKLGLEEHAPPGCHACGRCCEAFGAVLHASERDLERWKKLGREDLLAHAGETGWLWLDKESGQRLQQCPFLTRTSEHRSICGIHDIKPDICRAYPSEAVGRQCVTGVYFPVSLWAPGRSKPH